MGIGFPRFAKWRYPFSSIPGNILKIELYEARFWPVKMGMKVYPSRPDSPDTTIVYDEMFRVVINGRWYGPRKISFFTEFQIAEIVREIRTTGSIDCVDHNRLLWLDPFIAGWQKWLRRHG